MLSSFHMDGVAFMWFKWNTCINPAVTWQALTDALLIRFGPTDYENIDGTLAKLQQGSRSVQTYQTQSGGWMVRSCSDGAPLFRGLETRLDRRHSCINQSLYILQEAMGLARRQKEKL
ncbi:hypothetical protein MRB53_027799 [Persea americana]|uniref:Uncharacterized protein n=1 Tax=Persea americana TaxID=3435 RepID=A0ACC2KE78_PERAE|nr:hypothetical protein MRB53_027799 [Persea americana]